MNKAREILAQFFGGDRRIIPLKPQHTDHLAAKRRRQYRRVGPKTINKVGFKRFWRENQDHVGLRGMGRKQRRAIVKEWYRSE